MLYGLAGSVGFVALFALLHTIGILDWLGIFLPLVLTVCVLTTIQVQCQLPGRNVAHPTATAFVVMWWGVLLLGVCVPDSWLRAKPHGNLSEADVWVVFGFGLRVERDETHAGTSNRALADWIATHHDGTTTLLVQEGIRLALAERIRETGEAFPMECVQTLPHDSKMYVNTKQATQQAVTRLQAWHKERPLLLAHDLQLQRMVWDFAAAGYADVVVPELSPIPFDDKSTQHWGTHNRYNWTVWELLAARPATEHGRWLLFTLMGLASLVGWNEYRTTR
jgi:hypothetical protein